MTVDEFIKKWGPDPAKSPDEFLSFNSDLELLFKRVVPDVLLKMNAIKKIGDMDGAVLLDAVCEKCGRRWDAFFPDGMDKSKGIECPSCGEMSGRPSEEK